VPIVSKSHVVAVGQLATPLDALDQEISALGHTLLLMLPLAIIATSLTGIGLTHYMMRPVREIARAASQIESTNLSGRLSVRGSDEFAELATTFNGMLGRLDQSFQDLETAFVAQRRFAADASHELKTPLTAIKARVGVALRGECSPEKTREHVIAIGAAADSMSTIVRDLLFLSVSDEGRLSLELSQFFLLSCVLEAIESLRPLDSRPIELRVPANLEICADEKLLRRVLVNLLENAARHTPGDRTIGVEAKRRGHQFLLRVYDTGEGISAEDLAHVFERMFRVDSSRNRDSGGAGLGLAIVKSIVDAHGGSVSIESRIDAGTSVNILLPREPSTESFLA
jgi:two-component system OmpR family sensor kinase